MEDLVLSKAAVIFPDDRGALFVMTAGGDVLKRVLKLTVSSDPREENKCVIEMQCNIAQSEEHAREIIKGYEQGNRYDKE